MYSTEHESKRLTRPRSGRNLETINVVGGVGRVAVTGLGSRWDIGQEFTGGNDDLIVGDEGRGFLDIANGGWVRVLDNAFVGVEAESYGQVTVAGQDALWWVVDRIEIGNPAVDGAQGQLTVDSGGAARADESMTIAVGGRVDLDGGIILTPTLSNSGVIRGEGRIETTGTFTNLLGGDLRNAAARADLRERLLVTGPVENDGLVESIGGEMEFESSFTNNPTGQIFGLDAILRFRGPLVQDGDFFVQNTVVESTSALISSSTLSVGSGSSFLIGDLELTATSELDMILGDLHSELQITGSAMLDGTLSLSLDSGFDPLVGDSFRILAADDGISGMFATEDLPSISGVDFEVIYNTHDVVVNATIGPIFTGDFNGDGVVDGLDLAILHMNYGMMLGGGPAVGDANSDGRVDGDDFRIWQEQQGGPAPASAAAGSVPEPTSAVLCLLAASALATRTRRR